MHVRINGLGQSINVGIIHNHQVFGAWLFTETDDGAFGDALDHFVVLAIIG